jgi:hypothetical protein
MKNKLIRLINLFRIHVIGIPTPYGFKLRGQAYARMNQLSTDLKIVTAKYDAAVRINETTHAKLLETTSSLKEVHSDASKLSRALKEIVNHPNVVSLDTQMVVDSFRQQ